MMKKDDELRYLKGFFENEPFEESDQQKGVPRPPVEKEYAKESKLIPLPGPKEIKLKHPDLLTCIGKRKSHRQFIDKSISLDELSFLLWCTQGLAQMADDDRHHTHHAIKRVVPSGGSRHPFETYLAIFNVEGLEAGTYRYISTKHSLVFLKKKENLAELVGEGCIGQKFCGQGAVFFCWSAIPYRTAWRYGRQMSIKLIPLDAGHIGQNLHLSCEALGLGTCMIGAYSQKAIDELFELDGVDEFAIYMAPVGVPK